MNEKTIFHDCHSFKWQNINIFQFFVAIWSPFCHVGLWLHPYHCILSNLISFFLIFFLNSTIITTMEFRWHVFSLEGDIEFGRHFFGLEGEVELWQIFYPHYKSSSNPCLDKLILFMEMMIMMIHLLQKLKVTTSINVIICKWKPRHVTIQYCICNILPSFFVWFLRFSLLDMM